MMVYRPSQGNTREYGRCRRVGVWSRCMAFSGASRRRFTVNQEDSPVEIVTAVQRHLLRLIFDRGAEGASLALSKWLGEEVRLAVSEVELVELDQAAELLGPADVLVAACAMGLTGRLTGTILLVFEDRSGLAL